MVIFSRERPSIGGPDTHLRMNPNPTSLDTDRAAVYRDGVPWCINCSAQILLHNETSAATGSTPKDHEQP